MEMHTTLALHFIYYCVELECKETAEDQLDMIQAGSN